MLASWLGGYHYPPAPSEVMGLNLISTLMNGVYMFSLSVMGFISAALYPAE